MRFVLLPLLLLALTGCATTHTLDRSDAAGINLAHEDVTNTRGTITLSDGEEKRVFLLSVRPDVVVFREEGELQIVPLAEVDRLSVDNRASNAGRGLLIGLGLGVAIGSAILLSPAPGPDASFEQRFNHSMGPIAAVGFMAAGVLYGPILGAMTGRKRTYTFTGEARPQELPVTDPP